MYLFRVMITGQLVMGLFFVYLRFALRFLLLVKQYSRSSVDPTVLSRRQFLVASLYIAKIKNHPNGFVIRSSLKPVQ